MNKSLYGLIGLVVLVIAAALFGPSFWDWNGYKPEIRERIKAETGRDVTIEGDLSFAVMPSPRLAVADVRIPPEQLLPDEVYADLPRRNFIDELAIAQWRELGLRPSEPCSDAEFLRRASLFAISSSIDADLVRRMIAASVFGNARDSAPPQAASDSSRISLAEVEREHIERVLKVMEGNITTASAALGIDRRTWQRKLRSYGIEAQ